MAHIYGRVQGVGFRYYTQRKAQELGLKGWVRNLPDGSVECCLHGDEPLPLQAMQGWLAHGPAGANVIDITFSNTDCSKQVQGFSIVD